MAYSLPIFNVQVDWWQPGNTPAVNPIDLGHIPAQLYYLSRAGTFLPGKIGIDPGTCMIVRTHLQPLQLFGPPIQGGIFGWGDALGNAWYYSARYWDWVHAGFPNVYLEFICLQCDNTGVFPDAGR